MAGTGRFTFDATNVVALVGGAAVGASAGMWASGKIDAAALSTLIGSAMGAAFSVWGAFAVARRQTSLADTHFAKFANEVVLDMRDQAELAHNLTLETRGRQSAKELRRVLQMAILQSHRLVDAMNVFDKHVSSSNMGNYRMRLKVLHIHQRIRGHIQAISPEVERLPEEDVFDPDELSKIASDTQVKCQEYLGELGVPYKHLSGERSEKMRKRLEDELRRVWGGYN